MSTTNQTSGSNTSTLQFNPIAQGIYNQLTQQGGGALQSYINSPFNNSFFNQSQAMGQQGAKQAGANNSAAIKQAALTGGMNAGWLGAQNAQGARANQAMLSQANVGGMNAALQRQMSSAGTGLAFSPQLTGQTGNFKNTMSEGGLGSFLPQLVAAGFGTASAGLSNSMQNQATQAVNQPNFANQALSANQQSLMSPGTWSAISGSQMPGFAGEGSQGMGMTTNGNTSPFSSLMFQNIY